MPGLTASRLLALLMAVACCCCAPVGSAGAPPRLSPHPHGASPWPLFYWASDAATSVGLCTDALSALCRPPKAVEMAAAAAGLPEAVLTYFAAAMQVGCRRCDVNQSITATLVDQSAQRAFTYAAPRARATPSLAPCCHPSLQTASGEASYTGSSPVSWQCVSSR